MLQKLNCGTIATKYLVEKDLSQSSYHTQIEEEIMTNKHVQR